MSRIGKKPINLPKGVEVTVDSGNVIRVKGPKGELTQPLDKSIKVDIKDETLFFTRESDDRNHRAQHGLSRALVAGMVKGVTEGFEKKLQIVGVGYKAEKKGKNLVLHLGMSHDVTMPDPDGITTEAPDANTILVKGIDHALVGNHAAKIRAWRKPEPYKGKGIRYENEHVRKKEGKIGAKA